MNSKDQKSIVIWLSFVCALILLIVVVGGITRLTHSGLSMVDWKPLMGVIPPLSQAEWTATFAKYQQFPEYQLTNMDMTLDGFKQIFFWEYLHRILGRLVGVVFLLPFLYFLARRKLKGSMAAKVYVGFLLGGAQGFLGWYMVQSGLVNQPNVSHYRLAAHLCLAIFTLAYLFWIILSIRRQWSPKIVAPPRIFLWSSVVFTGMVALQIFYGALVAGLKAGLMYNTFPTMNGEWIPSVLTNLTPTFLSLFDNHTMVQFIHRGFGWLLIFGSVAFLVMARKFRLDPTFRRPILFVHLAILVQFALGVTTLVLQVPIVPAIFHQMGGVIVLALCVSLTHRLWWAQKR